MAADTSKWPALIQELARRYGVDPRAALAVASTEGLSGRVGDGGHAFGPFQVNDAGGVLTNRPGDHQAFAESPKGIEWAMQLLAKSAKGKRGAEAIKAIVTQFERPQDPDTERQKAEAFYGKGVGNSMNTFAAPTPEAGPQAPLGGDLRGALLQNVMGQNQAFASGGKAPTQPLSGLTAFLQKSLGFDKPAATPQEVSALPKLAVDANGKIKILGDTTGLDGGFLGHVEDALVDSGATQLKINSGYRSPEHNRAVGGAKNSNHKYGHALDGMALVNGQWVPVGKLLAKTAGKYGLRSGASFNWGGAPDIVHVDDNYNQGR